MNLTKEERELGRYLLAQRIAMRDRDETGIRVSGCAIVSFAAEHGEAKCQAIAEKLDRLDFFATNGVPLIKG